MLHYWGYSGNQFEGDLTKRGPGTLWFTRGNGETNHSGWQLQSTVNVQEGMLRFGGVTVMANDEYQNRSINQNPDANLDLCVQQMTEVPIRAVSLTDE